MSTIVLVTTVVFLLTCVPVALAHAAISGASGKVVVAAVTLVTYGLLALVSHVLFPLMLGATRTSVHGQRSPLLELVFAALLAIALCAPIGLLAARLLRKRRA